LSALPAAARVLKEARRPGSPDLPERISAVPRMVKATLSGEYDGLDKGRLGLIGLAIGYIVSPIDVVPEALLWVFGIADDVGVAIWVTSVLLVETDKFLVWEGRQSTAVAPTA
jgi:uncharacterized membrane protein YkvA (DUF1232 family)